MKAVKTVKIIFYLAVFLFVAKPFAGFCIISAARLPIEIHSILVKSFSKRKPEDLKDAEAKKAAVRSLISNPPSILLLSISALLGFLFPVVFKRVAGINYSFLNNLKTALIPVQPSLISGKLTI